MQAIKTEYFGPTDTKDSRIVASCQVKRMTFSYRHELNLDQNHANAALALKNDLGWNGEYYCDMVGGVAKDGCYYWVFVNELRIGDNGVQDWKSSKEYKEKP